MLRKFVIVGLLGFLSLVATPAVIMAASSAPTVSIMADGGQGYVAAKLGVF